MSSQLFINHTAFNNDVVKYSAPKQNQSGGKSVNIYNKDTNKYLQLSTPLILTWGVSDYEGNQKYDMALQFPSDEYLSGSKKQFLEKMVDFENKIKEDAITYSKEWFGKAKMSSEVVDALWSPMLKYPKNKETGEYDYDRSPTLRVKVPFYDNVWKVELYDTNEKCLFPDSSNPGLTPVDLIQKGSNAALVIQSGGIWFANGKFGVTWRLMQAVIQPKETIFGKCQIKLGDDEKKEISETIELPDEEDDFTDTVKQTSTMVEESDEEEEAVEEAVEEEEEEEELPPPVVVEEPVKKKRVVKKKAVSASAAA
tara:strand:+ start:3906 stop:4838 length:933 start_codon:yes stop_codon:yes gene_type:complete